MICDRLVVGLKSIDSQKMSSTKKDLKLKDAKDMCLQQEN